MKDYLLTLLVAAAVTYVLTPVVRRFAIMVGAIKQPRERDVHTAPVPLIGGVAMYLGLAAALLVANQIPQLHDSIANTGMVSGLLLAGGLLVVIGFIDDRWGMNAITKAAGQIAAGGILVATGAQLSWLPMPGGGGHILVPTPDQQTLLTILVVVATINAVNMIDGLDGLAAGIVAIAAMSFFAYYYSLTKLDGVGSLASPALASAVLIGICLGFLPHNFSPAKIFMGDTGAMLLGLVLAYAPIEGISSTDPELLRQSINRYPVIMPLLLPVVLLIIPYGDMLLAIVRRTRAGQSPFVADRKHLHHRLLDIGHSQRASVLIMYLWAAAFSGSVVWLSITRTELPRAQNHHGEPVIVFVLVTAAAIAALVLLSMPWRRWGQQAVGGPRAAHKPASGATAVAGSTAPTTESELVAAAARAQSAGDAVHPAAATWPGAGWRLASSHRDDEQLNGAAGHRTARGWSADDQDGHGRPAQQLWPGGDGNPQADEEKAGNGLTATGRWLPANGDGPSVVGTPPPADDSDWGWFRPAAADESDQGQEGGR